MRFFRVKNLPISEDIRKAKKDFLDVIDDKDAEDSEIHKSFYKLLYAVNVSNMRYNKVQFYLNCVAVIASLTFLTIFVGKSFF